jgi:SAM-dependent methyltransferase
VLNYQQYRTQMDTSRRAGSYPSSFNSSFRQQRERQCLLNLIAAIPPGSTVLDLPCGTGRVTRLIAEAGHRVLAGDSSSHMVDATRANLMPQFPDVTAEVMDAMNTGLSDQSVDAVVCNRLLHHFPDAASRIGVLSEFARVSRGLVIVSFSCSFGLDVTWQKFTRRLQGRKLRHYHPISLQQFRDEFGHAGLHAVACTSVLWGLSRMRYLVGLTGSSTSRCTTAAIGLAERLSVNGPDARRSTLTSAIRSRPLPKGVP